MQTITASDKTNKSCVSWNMLEMEFKISKLVKINVEKKNNFKVPFYGWGSTVSRLHPLWRGSIFSTTEFSEFLGTCSKWNLKFQNWSKPLCLGVSNLLKKDIYGQKQKKWTSSMNSAYSIVLVPSFSLNWQFWFFFIRFAQKGFFSSKTETVNTTYFLHNSAYSN